MLVKRVFSVLCIFVIDFHIRLSSAVSRRCLRMYWHESCNYLPNDDCCGLPESVLAPRVTRGSDAFPGDFPWIAIVNYGNIQDDEGRCGGSLINRNYVITAAHCISEERGSEGLFVRLGEQDIDESPDETKHQKTAPIPQDIPVKSYVVHEKFVNKHYYTYNDIALLRLVRPAVITSFVRPICLPFNLEYHIDNMYSKELQIAGWGKKKPFSGDVTNVLQEATVKVKPCKTIKESITPETMCAVGDAGQDSCEGDSGGPLVKQQDPNSPSTSYVLIGIVAYGDQCGVVGVYTRVTKYLTWILDYMDP